MESSQFTDGQQHFEPLEPLEVQGSTCDTFRVKLYGKLHFLKRLKAEYVGDIRYQEAFRKEFETGYRLEHPNLVRYISLTDDGILMEYVDGETLTQRLANHPDYFQNRKNTDKFLCQLLEAVSYLHSHQVLHLDLKPDNILLTRINSDVKLIDLGCCYTDTFTDTQGRTNRFAAPEQIHGESVDARTDIYAIGKILELLPNHHIYNKVIARCVAESPADRYPSVEELNKAINKRIPWKSIWLVLLTIAIATGILVYFQQPSNQERQQEQPITSVDTLPAIPKDSLSIDFDRHPKPTQTTTATTVPNSLKSFDIEQLKTDVVNTVLPKFNATLGALPDSVKPGSKQWAEAGWALEESLDKTDVLKTLILSYPNIPMEKVVEEYNTYIQSLITQKYHRAQIHQTK